MLTIQVCRDPQDAALWAGFFARNVSDSYISHGELQTARTTADGRWSPRLEQELLSELEVCVDQADADRKTADTWNGAFTIRQDDRPAGIAIVYYDRTAPAPFGIIEDIVVDSSMRGAGIGTRLVGHVLDDMRAAGLRRVFLESGINNELAHAVFERRGFNKVSVVMARSLEDD